MTGCAYGLTDKGQQEEEEEEERKKKILKRAWDR